MLASLTPAQSVVKIVHDELVELMGNGCAAACSFPMLRPR